MRNVANRLCRYPACQKFRRNCSISHCFRHKQVFAFNRNSRWLPKVARKKFLVKVASKLATYPEGQKFRRNRSISLRFRDKQVFAFNAEIQDGLQKWRGKQFLRKFTSRLCRYPVDQKFCRNRSILLRFQDKHVFAFNAEIQDGRQKWQENNFCEKSPVDPTDTQRLLRKENADPAETLLPYTNKRRLRDA